MFEIISVINKTFLHGPSAPRCNVYHTCLDTTWGDVRRVVVVVVVVVGCDVR